jgi:hypothetical protein
MVCLFCIPLPGLNQASDGRSFQSLSDGINTIQHTLFCVGGSVGHKAEGCTFGVIVGRVRMLVKAGAKPVQSRSKPGRDWAWTGFAPGSDRLCLGRCANLKSQPSSPCSGIETGLSELSIVGGDR